MALKSVYSDTRGDAKRLAKDVRPGDRLYVIYDVSATVNPLEDAQLYGEFIVTSDRAYDFTGSPMVCSAASNTGRGSMSIAGLLGKYGPVYTQPPSGLRNIAHPGRNHRPNPRLVDELKEAAGVSSKTKVGAGRRGWFS